MHLSIEDCGHYSRVRLPKKANLLACHAHDSKRYPYYLESQKYLNEQSRYDILFAFPEQKIVAEKLTSNNFITQFNQQFSKSSGTHLSKAELPFTGGWFVFFSYEYIAHIEFTLSSLDVDDSLPIAIATRIPAAIINDHGNKSSWLICEKGKEALLEKLYIDITSCSQITVNKPSINLNEDDPNRFLKGVQKINTYLKDGDTLQVNLSRQWSGVLSKETDYLDIYRALQISNPSPFAGLAVFDDTIICSSSPERLIKTLGNTVEMRPIAGTRPRDINKERDVRLKNELLSNTKENAEHIMLLDLIRNDLGRFCQTGSIKVDEKMTVESYSTVHHLVSKVSGLFDPSKINPMDIINAVFPGGTITGCPKIRCMEIINELENQPRGAYTGSMGYINNTGDMDLNILIRSIVVKDEFLNFRTGAGIVADSIANNELIETQHKAKGLLKALNIKYA